MAIEKFRLYHYPASRSARALWALYEAADCAVEIEPVDLYAGAQYSSAYVEKNPNHNVPALDIHWAGGRMMTIVESCAIAAFLGDAYPEKRLAPSPGASPERADYLQMLFLAAAQIDMALWQIRMHEHILPKAEASDAMIARYRRKFEQECEPQILARISAGGYICGEEFTMADCIFGHTVTWARGYKLAQNEAFRGYLSRLSKRPAFLKAFADARQFTLAPPEDNAMRAKFTG